MNLAEMRGKYNKITTELGDLWKKEDRSDEDESRIDAILAEMNDLGPKIERAATVEGTLAKAGEQRESAGRVSGKVPAPGAEERERSREQRDMRSIGQRFAESDALAEYRKRGGEQSQPMEVGSFYHRHQQPIEHHADMDPQELRTLVYTGALPADYISPQRVGGFFRGDDLQGSLRDVLINGTTTSDAILFFRETAFTNSAAGVAQATATADASGLKPESAITFEQDTAPVVTIAHWIPITRQTLQDAAQLQTYVEQRLLDGLRLEESDQLLNGSGTPDLDGLLGTSGVQDLDTTVYFAGDPVTDAGSDNENFNRILRAKTVIRTTGRARANFVVLNPADVETFFTATNTETSYYGPGPFSGAALTNLWGLRIVEDENLAAGTALVGDGRMAAVWDRMQSQIMIDTIDDQFVRNMLTILAEERLALTVFRPAAFAVVELA